MAARVSAKLVLALLAGLFLFGCKEQGGARSPENAPGVAQGPVNPDANVTSYACLDGSMITAGYPDRETAVVTYKDHAYPLKAARAASGSRYTGYGLEWWIKGSHASLAALRPGEETASGGALSCTAVNPEPASGTITRTSFGAPQDPVVLSSELDDFA